MHVIDVVIDVDASVDTSVDVGSDVDIDVGRRRCGGKIKLIDRTMCLCYHSVIERSFVFCMFALIVVVCVEPEIS